MPIAAVRTLFRRPEEKNADEYVTLGLVHFPSTAKASTNAPRLSSSSVSWATPSSPRCESSPRRTSERGR
jgi:hypothetical protein